MGLRRRLRKIIPREIRNNPLVAVVAVVALGPVALGAIGASTASIVGATVSATSATAIAVGTGVVTAGVTFAQTGDVSDSLKAGVRAGVGSAVGSAVSSSVTNAVAGQTGASIADLEPALRELPSSAGMGPSLAGAASITAGNISGEAARAAVTGRPIEEGALLGLAASIPQALAVAEEFNALHPVVQNVVASSARAAVLGQDIGDAALTAVITSSKIVSRAINEIPGGQEFMKQNPTYTKYVIDSVSSALAAQLQGKDVSESVIQRLVQTTAEVIGQEIENSINAKEVQEGNEKFKQAQQVEQETLAAQQRLNDLVRQNQTDVNNYNYYKDRYNYVYNDLYQRYDRAATEAADMAQRMRNDPFWDMYERQFGRTPEYYDQIAEQNRQQRDVFIGDVNEAVAGLNQSYEKLQKVNFFEEYNSVASDFQRLNNQLTSLTNDIRAISQNLAQYSFDLFTDFETEIATNIAPLTAFEDVTDVGDQDVLAQIQPVAPPAQLANVDLSRPLYQDRNISISPNLVLTDGFGNQRQISPDEFGWYAGKSYDTALNERVQDDALLNQIQEVAARPDVGVPTGGAEFAQSPTGGGLAIDIRIKPNIYESPDGRTVINGVGVLFEDDQAIRQLTPEEIKQISGIDVAYAPEEISNYLGQFGITKNAPVNAVYVDPNGAFYVGEDLNVYDARNERIASMSVNEFQQLTGQTPTESVRVNPDTLLRTNDGKLSQTARPSAELKPVGVGTGTPGAPAVDLGQAAPVEVVDPAFTVGFDLRDYGPGSPLSPNLALFEIGGGRGTPGGSSTETTFNLVSRDQGTGQETYDVGGKQYALVVLPDKQVLVPKEPSEIVVYLERDPVTNLPKMKEVPVSTVPPQDAQQIAEKVGQTAGGAPAGAEGAAGGRTAEEDRVATTEEQLQPGARPEEVATGVVAEQPAPSFPELVSGITEPTVPAPVPGQAAGTQTGAQPPGAGGIGDEITDEDIIRLIEGEIGRPGGGEGEGAPGEEGAGVGEGEEGVGPGAGEEGEGEGAGGEGTGTGTGTGPGTGEGGGEVTPSPDILLPTARVTTVGRRTFQRPGEAAPYRVTGMDESGILGRKQPLFGGDEDLQRAEWNRRSLRLKRLLGL